MSEENEKKYKVNPLNGRVYGPSALTTRDPERDKIEIKKKKRGRRGRKNKKLEVTDEMRDQVMIWASGKTSVETIAEMLDTEPKTVREKFRVELQRGKDICVARVHEQIFNQAMSGKRDALTAQSQKMFMQNVGDWKDKSFSDKKSTNGGDTDNIMKGMVHTEKMQRMLNQFRKQKQAEQGMQEREPDKSKPDDLGVN